MRKGGGASYIAMAMEVLEYAKEETPHYIIYKIEE